MIVGVHYDSSLTSSEEKRYLGKNTKLFKDISKEYKYCLDSVIRLGIIYYKFQINNKDGAKSKGMLKTQFIDFLHNGLDMTDATMNYYVESALDRKRNSTPIFHLESWLRAMVTFLKGSFDDKVQHCFKIYDRLGQGKITRNNMMFFLRKSIYGEKEDDDESIKDYADLLFKKLDIDRDGAISEKDYTLFCMEKPLAMECLGQCWPSRQALRAFSTTFKLKMEYK